MSNQLAKSTSTFNMQVEEDVDVDQFEGGDCMDGVYESGDEGDAGPINQPFSPILGTTTASFEEERLATAAMPFEVSLHLQAALHYRENDFRNATDNSGCLCLIGMGQVYLSSNRSFGRFQSSKGAFCIALCNSFLKQRKGLCSLKLKISVSDMSWRAANVGASTGQRAIAFWRSLGGACACLAAQH